MSFEIYDIYSGDSANFKNMTLILRCQKIAEIQNKKLNGWHLNILSQPIGCQITGYIPISGFFKVSQDLICLYLVVIRKSGNTR